MGSGIQAWPGKALAMEFRVFLFLSALGIVVVVCGALARVQRPDDHVEWCRGCRPLVHEETPLRSECGQGLSARGLRLNLPRTRRGLIIRGVLAGCQHTWGRSNRRTRFERPPSADAEGGFLFVEHDDQVLPDWGPVKTGEIGLRTGESHVGEAVGPEACPSGGE